MYLDKNTECQIAKGLQEGDRRAWLRLYEAYAESVWKNIARLMGDDSAAVSDVVQETFMAAARSAKNYDPERGSLWAWLWIIAGRQVALYYRKQKSNPLLTQARNWWTALDGEKLDWIDAKADAPPDILQSRQLATLVRCALSELPAEYQTLLLAKYVDSRPADKIAEQMGCSPVAVRSKLARARKAFQKAFRKIIRSAPGAQEVLL
ncbi:MAG: sigma-70 family RNA polymerase sigma factor [Phycisphaerae bacterium]|nr:sigma-70 family RNA polymerase sigma factor [Phycisphaerae bacterium]NIP54069.1 sigma-70 family RNA polymerase sigma factor [Phycisphaerae bacterium]NIS52997.1 sigma-70 family RNA polymerase sigma factor [Phycisphaerae bacterium]NIU10479.1 sigma-70 family RNA polymerase sigma factor [Phycisphaerae bacterium]NIU58267.1 sigma-70 family RNA polymerase sigma factor [Phycisphaerae bacterium]